MLCPSSPTIGQLRNRKQPAHLITIARVDAKDISDGKVVIRLLHDSDLVSGAHIALDDDSEIGAGPNPLLKRPWNRSCFIPASGPQQRDPGPRNSENRPPDLP